MNNDNDYTHQITDAKKNSTGLRRLINPFDSRNSRPPSHLLYNVMIFPISLFYLNDKIKLKCNSFITHTINIVDLE